MKVRVALGIVLGGFIILTGCSQKEEKIAYTAVQLERNDICNRRLKVYYGETETFSIGIEATLYTEEKAEAVLNQITADIKQIEECLGGINSKKLAFHILQKPLEGGLYIGGNLIYCTLEEIEDYTYREALIRAYYDLKEPAIIKGVTGYVFEEQINKERLREYFTQETDWSLLGLSGVRFYEEWNTEEAMKIARETAIDLVAYLMEKGQQDAVWAEAISSEQKQEWLESIGIYQTYENPYEEQLQHLTYTASKEYPLIIESSQGKYYFKQDRFLKSAGHVEEFLYKDVTGRKDILAYLEEDAPTNFRFINKEAKPSYYLSKAMPSLGGLTMSDERILLASPFDHLHEYVHTLTVNEKVEAKLWMQEGIADYLSQVINPENYRVELDFQQITSEEVTQYPEYYVKAMSYYKNHGGSFRQEEVNARLYIDAYAYASMNSVEKLPKDSRSIGEQYDATSQVILEGNELTYSEACSFTAYLIDNYSLDTYLGYYIGADRNKEFEACFGMPYNEEKQKWLDYLYRETKR